MNIFRGKIEVEQVFPYPDGNLNFLNLYILDSNVNML